MRKFMFFIQTATIFFFACSTVQANHVMIDTTLGSLRVELHVLPAEPFFTKDEVSAGKGTEGMLIMGGAKPLALDANPHPNHHLVIHVFDTKTGKAITNAKVKIDFQSLDKNGNLFGTLIQTPIVVMQVIGKGAQSTHYGNNVIMPDGPYNVSVVVNGNKMSFKVNVTEAADASMKDMDMH